MPDESTSPNLIELVRRMQVAINSGDIDEAMSMFSPNPVWDATGVGLVVYEGQAAIREYLAEWMGLLDDVHLQLDAIVDLGHGITFVAVLQTGRVKGSSGELDMRWAAVTEWADSLTKRVTIYADIDKGRAAAERLADSRGT
jgi:ketosteroid isomerase-like protein